MKFKKPILLLVAFFAGFSACMAQVADTNKYNYLRPANEQMERNFNNSVSAGFGAGGDYPYFGTFYTQSPNVILSFEHTTFRHVGPGNICLGILASYKQIKSNYEDYSNGHNYTQQWNYYVIGARVIYHVSEFPSKMIEPYAVAMVGYYITAYKFTSDDPDYLEPGNPGYYLIPNKYPNFFEPGLFVGIRSRFSSHGSAWLEAGYGYAAIAFGLSYKM